MHSTVFPHPSTIIESACNGATSSLKGWNSYLTTSRYGPYTPPETYKAVYTHIINHTKSYVHELKDIFCYKSLLSSTLILRVYHFVSCGIVRKGGNLISTLCFLDHHESRVRLAVCDGAKSRQAPQSSPECRLCFLSWPASQSSRTMHMPPGPLCGQWERVIHSLSTHVVITTPAWTHLQCWLFFFHSSFLSGQPRLTLPIVILRYGTERVLTVVFLCFFYYSVLDIDNEWYQL